mgnify:CR=1 FL=1
MTCLIYENSIWERLQKYELYFETKGYWTKDQLDKKKFIEGIKNLIIVYKKDLELMESQNLIFTS